jgi:hypothetical protein
LLADAFGNIIDNVQYLDTIPWPEADGNGYYLQLTDPALDNALAENWTASNEVIVTGLSERDEMKPAIYPNPAQHLLHIQATDEIERITLSDLQGRLLIDIPVHHERVELDISRFSRGTYILRITGAGMIYTGKIIKN